MMFHMVAPRHLVPTTPINAPVRFRGFSPKHEIGFMGRDFCFVARPAQSSLTESRAPTITDRAKLGLIGARCFARKDRRQESAAFRRWPALLSVSVRSAPAGKLRPHPALRQQQNLAPDREASCWSRPCSNSWWNENRSTRTTPKSSTTTGALRVNAPCAKARKIHRAAGWLQPS
jgi:hypothetical protein